jgi:hypothetical protein
MLSAEPERALVKKALEIWNRLVSVSVRNAKSEFNQAIDAAVLR